MPVRTTTGFVTKGDDRPCGRSYVAVSATQRSTHAAVCTQQCNVQLFLIVHVHVHVVCFRRQLTGATTAIHIHRYVALTKVEPRTIAWAHGSL